MVFQDYGLYRHLTVFGNIAYPLEVRRLDKATIRQKVRAVAKTMQISDILERKPDQLSAGQLQRVAIARMLVRDADVFLMDEPMSHLDAQLRGQMRAELRHIQKTIGVTTIFVTHDQLEAMTMADRIIVMKDGEMLQFATPREIFERPATEFVASFVGEPQMNMIDATLKTLGHGDAGRLWAVRCGARRENGPGAWPCDAATARGPPRGPAGACPPRRERSRVPSGSGGRSLRSSRPGRRTSTSSRPDASDHHAHLHDEIWPAWARPRERRWRWGSSRPGYICSTLRMAGRRLQAAAEPCGGGRGMKSWVVLARHHQLPHGILYGHGRR